MGCRWGVAVLLLLFISPAVTFTAEHYDIDGLSENETEPITPQPIQPMMPLAINVGVF